jgi:hypothetical protein
MMLLGSEYLRIGSCKAASRDRHRFVHNVKTLKGVQEVVKVYE